MSAKRTFSYAEAKATLPHVKQLTARAVSQIEAIVNRLQSREEMESRKDELDDSVQQIIQAWAREIAAVGCEIKGLWLVDWDSGDGYYCWRYPEESLSHFHGYDEGFAGRVPIN